MANIRYCNQLNTYIDQHINDQISAYFFPLYTYTVLTFSGLMLYMYLEKREKIIYIKYLKNDKDNTASEHSYSDNDIDYTDESNDYTDDSEHETDEETDESEEETDESEEETDESEEETKYKYTVYESENITKSDEKIKQEYEYEKKSLSDDIIYNKQKNTKNNLLDELLLKDNEIICPEPEKPIPYSIINRFI